MGRMKKGSNMVNKKSHSDSRALQSEVWIDIPLEDVLEERASKNAENVQLVHYRPRRCAQPTREYSAQMRKRDKVDSSDQQNSFKIGKEQSYHSSKYRPLGSKELFEAGGVRSRILEKCRSDDNENRRNIKTKGIVSRDTRQAQYPENRGVFETGEDSVCNPRLSHRRNRDMIETRREKLCTPKPCYNNSRTLLETGRVKKYNVVSSHRKIKHVFEASEGRQSYDSNANRRKKRVVLGDGTEQLQNLEATYRRNIDALGTVSDSHSHRKNRHILEAEDGKPYNPVTNHFKNNYVVEESLRNPRVSYYENIDALEIEKDPLNGHKSRDHRKRDKLGSKLPNPRENSRKTSHALEIGDQTNNSTPSHHERRVTLEANENSNTSLIGSEIESGTNNSAFIVRSWRGFVKRTETWWKILQFRKQVRVPSFSYVVVFIVSIICIVGTSKVSVDLMDIPLSILMVCIVCSAVTLLCERGCLLKYMECRARLSEGKPAHDSEYDFRPTCRDFFFCCCGNNNTDVPPRRSQYVRRSDINTAFEHEVADVSNISPKECPQIRLVEEKG